MGSSLKDKSARIPRVARSMLWLTLAGLSLANTDCSEKPTKENRALKRRVQMGRILAPQIELPQGGRFDFAFVANMQLYYLLSQTQTFTTATISPDMIYSTEGLSQEEASVFRRCEEEEAAVAEALNSGMLKPGYVLAQKTTFSSQAACMMEIPHGIVSGAILDFTMTNSAGVSIRGTQLSQFGGLDFTFQKFELAMTLKAQHPLILGGQFAGDRKLIVANQKNAYAKDYGVGLKLNFSGLELGPSFYYKTPLRRVVDDGLRNSLEDLARRWDEVEPWYAHVIRACDKYIYINAGNRSDAGLKVGDILRIQNVTYRWQGEVCRSQLLGQVDALGGPVGYARIIQVGDTISAAEILDKDPAYPYSRDQIIKPGARVYVEKLYQEPPSQAAATKSVRRWR
jgi:hypothetical protein